MQNSRRGSMVIAVGLIILAFVLAGIIAYRFRSSGKIATVTNYAQDSQIAPEQGLTKTDEVSDIEQDLNSTNAESLDEDVIGITSQVE